MKIPILYGLTHDSDGNAHVRVPRVTKVGIGLPRGVKAYVYIDPDTKRWVVRKLEARQGGKPGWTILECKSRGEAESAYRDALKTSPELNYPQKLSHFYFTRPNADGSMEPDWDAIEAHGPRPTELDIVFLDEEPFSAAFEWWTKSELQCRGNGRDAKRLVSLASTDAEKKAAELARKRHDRYFDIKDGCYNYGCPYARPTLGDGKERPPVCKPSGNLTFQLYHSLRIGGNAQFSTTSYRSVSNLFSCLMVFAAWTGKGNPHAGRVAGIPLKLVLRAHRTRMGGAYNVALEFRSETVAGLMRQLSEAAAEFRTEREALDQAIDVKQIAAPAAPLPEVPETEEEFAAMSRQAEAMAAEFYADEDEDESGDPRVEQPTRRATRQVASATHERTAGLMERIQTAGRGRSQRVAAAAPPDDDGLLVQASDAPPVDPQATEEEGW